MDEPYTIPRAVTMARRGSSGDAVPLNRMAMFQMAIHSSWAQSQIRGKCIFCDNTTAEDVDVGQLQFGDVRLLVGCSVFSLALHIPVDFRIGQDPPFVGAPRLLEQLDGFPAAEVCRRPTCRAAVESSVDTYNQAWIYREAHARGYLDVPFLGMGSLQRRSLSSIIAEYLVEPWLAWGVLDERAAVCRSLVPSFGKRLVGIITEFKKAFVNLEKGCQEIGRLTPTDYDYMRRMGFFRGGLDHTRDHFRACVDRLAHEIRENLWGPVLVPDRAVALPRGLLDLDGITEKQAEDARLSPEALAILFHYSSNVWSQFTDPGKWI